MPRRKCSSMLRHLCLAAVAEHMSFWCDNYNEQLTTQNVAHIVCPFDCLPLEVIQDLIDFLNKEKLLELTHLQLLLRPETQRLNLAGYFISPLFGSSPCYDRITQLIRIRCHNVKYLCLSYMLDISPESLIQLPPSLPSLQVLHLRKTKTSDAVLAALGCHSRNLQALDVSYCRNVTDAGIRALCNEGLPSHEVNPRSDCLKLSMLSVKGTSVTEAGIMCALNSLPFLKHFACDEVALALYHQFRNVNVEELKIKKFQVKELLVKLYHFNEAKSCRTMQLASELCPHVTDLTLLLDKPLHKTALLVTIFKNLRELCIYCRYRLSALPFKSIAPVLGVVGAGLTSLRLGNVLELDLRTVGRSCPNLQEFIVLHPVTCSGNILVNKLPSDVQLFAHLSMLDIKCNPKGPDMSSLHLLHLLSWCRRIENLRLQSCQLLTDQLMEQILKVNSFDYLSTLKLFNCNNIHINSIVALMKLQNPLRTVSLDRCRWVTKTDFHNLMKMAADDNLHVDVTWNEYSTLAT